MQCPKCGFLMLPFDKTCPRCTLRQDNPQTAPPPPPIPPVPPLPPTHQVAPLQQGSSLPVVPELIGTNTDRDQYLSTLEDHLLDEQMQAEREAEREEWILEEMALQWAIEAGTEEIQSLGAAMEAAGRAIREGRTDVALPDYSRLAQTRAYLEENTQRLQWIQDRLRGL